MSRLIVATRGILIPWPGIKTSAPVLGAQSLNHRTTREFPNMVIRFVELLGHSVFWECWRCNPTSRYTYCRKLWLLICVHGEGNGSPLQYSCLKNPMDGGAWWAAVHGVAKSQTRLSDFTFTFPFHALEKEMATRSSVLAWRISGTGEPGGLPSVGSHRVGHDWSNLAAVVEAAVSFFKNCLLAPISKDADPEL